MILEWLDRISGRIYQGFGKIGARCEEQTEISFKPNSRSAAFYRRVLIWQNNGAFFRWKRRLFRAFLKCRVSDLGIFFLLWSGIELGGGLLLRGFDRFSADVILPLVQLLSASVLLRSNRSCARCIGGSCFFRWLLFDVCALSESDFVISEGGRSNRAAPVLSGILVGVLGVWLTPAIVLGIFSGLVLTAFLAAVPEAILTLILFVLPFLNALSHPTWILCGVLFLGLTVCFGKAISGKRQFAWKDVDLLALWLGVLFILGGVVSHGSAIDGLRRGFLMLSAWLLTRMLLQSPTWRRRGRWG